MAWTVFIAVAVGSSLLTLALFETTQAIAIRSGEIPARGVETWETRPFFHWNKYAILLYGDLIFLPILNACVATALYSMQLTSSFYVITGAIALVALPTTVMWYINVREEFIAGTFARWDFGFTAPNAHVTIAGKAHLAYFWFEAAIIGVALLYVILQPGGVFMRTGILGALIGYSVTVFRDWRRISLYIRPLAPSAPQH